MQYFGFRCCYTFENWLVPEKLDKDNYLQFPGRVDDTGKLLTGDLLKALCEMGHGDTLVIADANFPAEAIARRLICYPGIDGATLLDAMAEVFPLDTYVDTPAE